jgi:hypothetical protein
VLAAAFDVGPHAPQVRSIAPGIIVRDDWELLLLGSAVDAVVVGRGGAGLAERTGIGDDERRADQLRKLAQERVPLLVTCPACEAIVGFEIEMIRRDVGGVIVPYVPGGGHLGVLELAAMIPFGAASSVGAIEQVWFEREQGDRSRDAVLTQLARDITVLRQVVGPIRSVSAMGAAAPVGRDPLGPRPAELPSLSNLSVHFGVEENIAVRWSIGPVLNRPQGKLTVIGERGRAVLYMPDVEPWSLQLNADEPQTQHYQSDRSAEDSLWRLSHAMASDEFKDTAAWLNACRDQEAAEAVDRSLARGRTIELYNEPHTEDASFKGIMSMGGCLLLFGVLALVMIAAVVEGLQLPLRNWPLWRLWPVYLLVSIVAFLLLQLLKLAVRRDAGEMPG